jgi:hypothetical protein
MRMAKKSKAKPLRSFVATVSIMGRAEVYFEAADEDEARAMARSMNFGDTPEDRLLEWEYDAYINVTSND